MTLNEVRAQIDAIDPKIKALFLEQDGCFVSCGKGEVRGW